MYLCMQICMYVLPYYKREPSSTLTSIPICNSFLALWPTWTTMLPRRWWWNGIGAESTVAASRPWRWRFPSVYAPTSSTTTTHRSTPGSTTSSSSSCYRHCPCSASSPTASTCSFSRGSGTEKGCREKGSEMTEREIERAADVKWDKYLIKETIRPFYFEHRNKIDKKWRDKFDGLF